MKSLRRRFGFQIVKAINIFQRGCYPLQNSKKGDCGPYLKVKMNERKFVSNRIEITLLICIYNPGLLFVLFEIQNLSKIKKKRNLKPMWVSKQKCFQILIKITLFSHSSYLSAFKQLKTSTILKGTLGLLFGVKIKHSKILISESLQDFYWVWISSLKCLWSLSLRSFWLFIMFQIWWLKTKTKNKKRV